MAQGRCITSFRDHLGTITHLKDASTGTVTEYSFDAWGRRRDKDDWTMTLTGEPLLFADRGFTSHEYLEDFKLYNMNGRLYDPVVGRFLNADPVIQDPGNTQSYNRYSYCLNNPLKYSDPSGYINQNPQPRPASDIGLGGGSVGSWMDNFGEPGTGYWGDPWGSSNYGSHITSHLNKPGNSYNLNYTLKGLKKSKDGGFWSRANGMYIYNSQDEAFIAGVVYIEINNSWSQTSARSLDKGFDDYLASTIGNYELTASLEGIGILKSKVSFDIDKAVSHLNANARSKSLHACARFVRLAIEAGGIDTRIHPIEAKKYGPFLLAWGFVMINSNDYNPNKGDITVIQSYPGGSIAGHIQMYNGSQWVSDFMQSGSNNGFWPGPGYRTHQPAFQIYRWETNP